MSKTLAMLTPSRGVLVQPVQPLIHVLIREMLHFNPCQRRLKQVPEPEPSSLSNGLRFRSVYIPDSFIIYEPF